jgi:hypothetical protein
MGGEGVTLVAFRISDGKGGLVAYELSDLDKLEGSAIRTGGKKGTCWRCPEPVGGRTLYVAQAHGSGRMCLTCAVAIGALVEVE